MSTLAQSEREALCNLLTQVGPDAPTLCEGWTTADLAAHLITREGDALAAPGMFMPALAPLTRHRMARQLRQGNWTHLVARLRQGTSRATMSALPGVDRVINGMELFIHHEDVRRATDGAATPRPLKVSHEEELWRRAVLLARLTLPRRMVGVVLENPLDPEEQIRVRSGSETVTLVGKASEMVLWLSGRCRVADVELIGTPEGVAGLTARPGRL